MKSIDAPVGAPVGPLTHSDAKQKSWVLTGAKAMLSVALILWVLRETPLDEVVAALRSANIGLVLLATSLHLLGYILSATRWRLLLRAHGVNPPLTYLFRSYIIGLFFNTFLPTTIGGDAVRAYDAVQLGQNKAGAVAVVFMERFLGLLALFLFALIALPVVPVLPASLPFLQVWIPVIVVCMLAIVVSIFMPSLRVSGWLAQSRLPLASRLEKLLADAFYVFRGRVDVLAKALGLSLLLQINVIVHYYLIAQALVFPVPLYHFFVIIPIALFLMALPVSINGIGVRENVFAMFFVTVGVANSDAIAFAWLAFATVLLQALVGGCVYVMRK